MIAITLRMTHAHRPSPIAHHSHPSSAHCPPLIACLPVACCLKILSYRDRGNLGLCRVSGHFYRSEQLGTGGGQLAPLRFPVGLEIGVFPSALPSAFSRAFQCTFASTFHTTPQRQRPAC